MKSRFLLGTSIYLTLYFIVSSLVYILSAEDFVAQAPVFGALYLMFVFVHEGLVLLSVILNWSGYFSQRKGFCIFASVLALIAAIELGMLLYPLLFVIPFALVNLFVKVRPKAEIKTIE